MSDLRKPLMLINSTSRRKLQRRRVYRKHGKYGINEKEKNI